MTGAPRCRARRRAWVSWSGGKDSAWALHGALRDPTLTVTGLLTMVTERYQRISMHGVRRTLLEMQAARLGLPLEVVELPSPCTNEDYERRLGEAMARAAAAGVGEIVFGDLFLADVRAYREARCEGTGITPRFPLWGSDTAELARGMLASGLRATLTCVDPRAVPAELVGRAYDEALLDALPADADPCGEQGEFHTFVWNGPDFASPIAVTPGDVVEREGFRFADLLPDLFLR